MAEQAHLAYESKFKQITLKIHSSLDAVGLTAAVAKKLASCNIREVEVSIGALCHAVLVSVALQIALCTSKLKLE